MNESRPAAVFWIEAGPAVGGGHSVRANVLAAALAVRGFAPALRGLGARTHAVFDHGFPAEELDDETFLARVERERPAVTIVDRPHTRPATPAQVRRLRAAGTRVVAIDAAPEVAAEADVELNLLGHPAHGPRPAVRLLGPAHVVVRPGLAELRQRRPSSRAVARRVLVGFGASDPAGLAARLLRALVPAGDRVDLEVLVGPLTPTTAREDVHRAARLLPACRVTEGATDPSEALLRAEVGVFPFGLTFLEAATSGLPCLLWHPSPAHADVAIAFLRQLAPAGAPAPEVAIDLGEHPRTPASVVADRLLGLLESQRERERLSSDAGRVFDGRGAERAAEAIERSVT